MSRFKKTVLPIILLSFLTGNVVMASPDSDKLQNQQNQLQQQTDQLKNAQNKTQSIEQNIEKLDSSIQKTMIEINTNKQQIASTENDIIVADKQVQEAQANLDAEIKLYGQRMRAMYVKGSDNLVEAVLDSKGFSDFLSRVQIVVKISNLDKKIVSEISDYKTELNDKKKTLADKKDKLVSLKADNEKKMATLVASKDEQSKLIKQAKNEEEMYSSQIASSKVLINQTLKQIENMKNSIPKYVPGKGSAPISDNALVAFASNYLGTDYVWGGTTPVPGFDCSGFTQYVYNHFGVAIGRTTYDQINSGVAVSKDQLKAGDLVLFGSWSDPHHVGMYVGNGTFIEAPHTGAQVRLATLAGRDDFVTGRRISK